MTVIITSSDFLVAQLPNTNGPGQRSSATASVIGSDFYIYGGNPNYDFWQYTLSNAPQWTQLPTANGPSDRQYASSVSINSDFFIIGGQSSPNNSTNYSDLWKYNIVSQTWTQLSYLALVSSGIYGHTSVAYNQDIFVFGGQDGNGNLLNSIYQYNTPTGIWSLVSTTGGPPQNRVYHSASIIGSDMFIFGGLGLDSNLNTLYFSDFWQYNVNAQTWTQLASGPLGRSNHSSVVTGNSIVIFGGGGSSTPYFSDFWQYDLTTNTWTQLLINNGPAARAGQVAAAIGANMLIFGGNNNDISLSNNLWGVYLQPVTLILNTVPPPQPVLTNSPYTVSWTLSDTNAPPFLPIFNITSNALSLNTISSDNPGTFSGTSPSDTGIFPVTITATIPYFNFSISDTVNLSAFPEFSFENFQVTPSSTTQNQSIVVSWNILDTETSPHYQITILRSDGSTLLSSDFTTTFGNVSDVAPSTPGNYQYTASAYSVAFSTASDRATTTLQVTQIHTSDTSDIVVVPSPPTPPPTVVATPIPLLLPHDVILFCLFSYTGALLVLVFLIVR